MVRSSRWCSERTVKSEQRKPERESRIPRFADRAEEAEFWGTHDIVDYQDELKPARARFSRGLSEVVTIRLNPETLQRLRELAREKGIGPTTLARMWILEKLKKPDRLP